MQNLIGEIIMKRSIYFMRHGESEANVLGLLCGSIWDAELSATGINQIKSKVEILKQRRIKTIISSPLKRALHSAKILSKELTFSEVRVTSDFLEQSYGEWEGKPFLEVKEKFLEGMDPPNGESHSSFKSRIIKGFTEIETIEGNLLIVAHGGVGTELMELRGLQKRLIENGELIQLV